MAQGSSGSDGPGTNGPNSNGPNSNGMVLSERRGEVATVTFTHPKGNCLSRMMLTALRDEFTSLADDASVRVVLLQSGGDGAFSGGAFFSEVEAISEPAAGKDFFAGFAEVILAMRRCPHLIVARVQGKAVGGGVGLVAAADYAVALDGASGRLSEFELGLGPFVIGPAVERKIGTAAFAEMALDCAWRDASWLRAHGLYSALAADREALHRMVEKQLNLIASAGSGAVKAMKQMMWDGAPAWDGLLIERAATSGRLTAERNRSKPR